MKQCLNCNENFNDADKYCHHCGQKTILKNLSLYSIVKDFFSNLFNFETKIWRSLKDIWIPAKLTNAFVQGKRSQYYNPIRFFLLILFSFFALFLSSLETTFAEVKDFSKEQEKNVWQNELALRFDSLSSIIQIDSDSIQVFKQELFLESSGANDSTENVMPDIDSLLKEKTGIDTLVESKESSGIVQFDTDGIDEDLFQIDGDDLFALNEKELLDRYGNESPYRSFFIVQSKKIIDNLDSSISFFIGNGTWAVILIILLFALSFKLIYFRRHYLLGEHFIFHLYGHARLLLMTFIALVISKYTALNSNWFWICFVIGVVYFYLGMLKFYQQGKVKTFIKLLIALYFYVMILCVTLFLILVVSFIIL